MKKLFIYGFGYTAKNFVEQFYGDFSKIISSTRNKEIIKNGSNFSDLINNSNITKYFLDNDFTHVLITAPPNNDGDPFYLNFKKLITKLKKIQWIGYLSATNVYGHHEGRYVDETSATLPLTQKGKNRLLAENQWLTYCKDLKLPIHIFRIAGIYGPDRNIIKKIQEQKTIDKVPTSQYFSRIYIDDLVNVLRSSMLKPNPFSIYNIADDLPSSLNDIIELVCHEMKISKPDEIINRTKAAKNSFLENKKVDNSLMKNELEIELKYATYSEGYKKIIESIL